MRPAPTHTQLKANLMPMIKRMSINSSETMPKKKIPTLSVRNTVLKMVKKEKKLTKTSKKNLEATTILKSMQSCKAWRRTSCKETSLKFHLIWMKKQRMRMVWKMTKTVKKKAKRRQASSPLTTRAPSQNSKTINPHYKLKKKNRKLLTTSKP